MATATLADRWWMRGDFDGREIACSPSLAEQLLSINTKNRTIQQGHVDALAGNLVSGNWVSNGTTVKVTRSGVLADGQHRLAAIVQTGIPAIIRVVLVDDDVRVRDSLGYGAPRRMLDSLKMDGYAHPEKLNPAIRAMILYARGSDSYLYAKYITPSEVRAALNKAPRIVTSVEATMDMKRARSFPTGARALLYYGTSGQDHHDEFWGKISGDIASSSSDPEWVAFDAVDRAQNGRQKRLSRMWMANVLVRAWNARVSGETIRRITGSPRKGGAYEIEGFSRDDAARVLGILR